MLKNEIEMMVGELLVDTVKSKSKGGSNKDKESRGSSKKKKSSNGDSLKGSNKSKK